MKPLLAIYILLGVLIVYVIAIYNRLVKLRQRVKEAQADIEVQLKRRADLVPNLVETVKGYMGHEVGVLTKVTEARTKFLEAKNVKEEIEKGNILASTLKTLFAVAENYPDLKANQNFLELQRELRDAEDKIQAARRLYNTVVQEYNSFREYFPNNIFAKIFSFGPAEYFDIPTEEEKLPKVDF
jgi:LemA protein